MSFADIVQKLEELKAFVTQNVPDAIDRSADAITQVADALRDVADFLRIEPAPGILSAGDQKLVARLEKLKGELEGPRVKAGWEWLVPIILEVIRLILERRRPQAA